MILTSVTTTQGDTQKEKIENRHTEKEQRKTKHRETDCKEKIDQVGLQETPHLQDCKQNHSEYSEC
jgi:hypothetical protein